MKKLVFVLIAALSAALTSCSVFDSKPIEAKIIGTTSLQEEKGLIFAEFDDSVRYAPVIIYTGEKVGRNDIEPIVEPVVGMQVTAFTSNIHQEPVFFAGKVTAAEIERYYQHNFLSDNVEIIVVGMIFLMLIISISMPSGSYGEAAMRLRKATDDI